MEVTAFKSKVLAMFAAGIDFIVGGSRALSSDFVTGQTYDLKIVGINEIVDIKGVKDPTRNFGLVIFKVEMGGKSYDVLLPLGAALAIGGTIQADCKLIEGTTKRSLEPTNVIASNGQSGPFSALVKEENIVAYFGQSLDSRKRVAAPAGAFTFGS